LQPDRLLLNWRKKPDAGDYPHFETVTQEFQKLYLQLERFAEEHELGPIDPDQCEMTYVNRIDLPKDGMPLSKLDDYFQIKTDMAGAEWGAAPEDAAFVLRYVLAAGDGAPPARLYVKLTPQRHRETGMSAVQLELTVRGAPAPGGLSSVTKFHQIAHEAIVRCFAGITTREAHERWGRLP
jgi:uncharacterized protein (TIGR04255 family)